MSSLTGKRLLIANRGEIAIRILRTAKQLGMQVFTVHSDVDRNTPAVQHSDFAIPLKYSPSAKNPYLDIEQIVDISLKNKIDVIHPGYGFLSENADFRQSCEQASIGFAGPSARAISLMADKKRAKELAVQNAIPVIEGFSTAGLQLEEIEKICSEIGYPVLLKATHGGGGRGIRKVETPDQLQESLKLSRDEAAKYFNNDEVIVEKFVSMAKHIEVQIIADDRGKVLHLGERDCSLQRRNQKLIEEAPAMISATVREKLQNAAIDLCRSCDYLGAGTVEFLLDNNDQYYFLEMNTRLQVEHPVTEMITNVDIVKWQLEIAIGKPLEVDQSDIVPKGHAIEARLNAECAQREFLPQSGWIRRWQVPQAPHLRCDHWMENHTAVSDQYDSLLAKIISYGEDRQQARENLLKALRDTRCFGIATNQNFLIHLLQQPDVINGTVDTHFIDKKGLPAFLARTVENGWDDLVIASLCLYINSVQSSSSQIKGWSNSTLHLFTHQLLSDEQQVRVTQKIKTIENGRHTLSVSMGAAFTADICLEFGDNGSFRIIEGSSTTEVNFFISQRDIEFAVNGYKSVVHRPQDHGSREKSSPEFVLAPMGGTIIDVPVSVGDSILSDQVLVTLEAMKMQMTVRAPHDGVVKHIYIDKDQSVNSRQQLIYVERRIEDAK